MVFIGARRCFCIWVQASGFSVPLGTRKGRGLNKIGRSFLCNKSPAHVAPWRRRSGDFVKVQYKMGYEANEIRGRGLEMPHKAQAINKSRRSYDSSGYSEGRLSRAAAAIHSR